MPTMRLRPALLILLLFATAIARGEAPATVEVRGTADVSGVVAAQADLVDKLNAQAEAMGLAAKRCDELAARIVELEQRPPATEIDLEWAGCRLNDPAFDNGLIINELLSRVGRQTAGGNWLNRSFYQPGGAIFFSTPLVFPAKTGVTWRGNGLGLALNENSYYTPNTRTMGGPVSRLIYVGPADQPAIKLYGFGLDLRGVMLQRGLYPSPPPSEPNRDGSVGIEICGGGQPPAGKHRFDTLTLVGWDTAIVCSGTNHADETLLGQVRVQDCRTVLRSTNPQTCGWHFTRLSVGGRCETVFDIQRGGGIVVEHLSLMAPAIVWRLGTIAENNCSFALNYFKADNGAAGWRLVDAPKCWLLKFRAWGEIGNKATPGPHPVVITPASAAAADRLDVDIDLIDGATGMRWEW